MNAPSLPAISCLVLLSLAGCHKSNGAGNVAPSGGGVPSASTSIPQVDAVASPTASAAVRVTGRALEVGSTIRVEGGASTVEVQVQGSRSFGLDVPLQPNHVNHLFLREFSLAGEVSPVVPLDVTQDGSPPTVAFDSPPDGALLASTTINVSGRVGDVLSGFMGLDVQVNGLTADVNVGQGTNGTWIVRDLVIPADTSTDLVVLAADGLGNETTRTITVFHMTPTGDYLAAHSGDQQRTAIGGLLGAPIEVIVRDATGMPAAGRTVRFDVAQNDGRIGASSLTASRLAIDVQSDASGIARAFWRLGGTAGEGNNRVEASGTGLAGLVSFTASADPGAAAQINVSTGTNQRGEADGPATLPLRAWVSDSCNGVAGIPVRFVLTEGEGYIVGPGGPTLDRTVTTGTTGHAEVGLVYGPNGGHVEVEASFPANAGMPARFSCYGIPPTPLADTRLTGVVHDNASRPIGGAACRLVVSGIEMTPTDTDEDGRFLFENILATGPADLYVDGLTATTLAGQAIATGSFPSLHFEMVIVGETDNKMPGPVLLPALDPANERSYSSTQDTILEVAEMGGLRMIVRAGSMSIGGQPAPDGTPISLNQVHYDDVPMPMPDGAAPPFAWTLQPGGAHFDPPVEIEYPNMNGLPAGGTSYFLSFDHDTGEFEIVATGRVASDGSVIRTDPGSGITVAGWGCNCPPYAVTGEAEATGVQILGEDCRAVAHGEPVTFTAVGFPEGGTYSWSGGDPVGDGGSNGPVYVARIYSSSHTQVTCLHTYEGIPTQDVVAAQTEPGPVSVTGKVGDIITVDVAPSGLLEPRFVTQMNSIGKVAAVDMHVSKLRDDRKFWFVPTAEGTDTIRIEGRLDGAQPGAPLMGLDVEITVQGGYSSSGPDRVSFGATRLDRFRQEQRLAHLGFRDSSGNELTVNGMAGAATQQAIGLFCASASDGNSTAARTSFTAAGQSFINATNAPRWKEVALATGSYSFSGSAERWGTSWTEEVLSAAAGSHSPAAGFAITDISEQGGGFLSPHMTHRAGMDADVDEPTTQDNGPLYWFRHHGGAAPADRVVMASGTSPTGAAVVEGDLISRMVSGALQVSVVAHGTAPPATWSTVSARDLVGEDPPGAGTAWVGTPTLMTAAYSANLMLARAGYDRTELTNQFTALFAATTTSGASCARVAWNDPFFYTGAAGIAGQNISYVAGHNGHYHIDFGVPASATTPPPAFAAVMRESTASHAGGTDGGSGGGGPATSVLDDTWTVTIEGQTVPARPDGSFRVSNVTAPDQWGPGGPGSSPDFISDNALRLSAISNVEGNIRYAFSEPFRIEEGETTIVRDFTITTVPPLRPVSIELDLGVNTLTQLGATAVGTVTAHLSDGTMVDATGALNWSMYSTSNPLVATVDEDGLVTAQGNGIAYIRATNDGATAVAQIVVSANDPLTVVRGIVQLANGIPVFGAEVRVAGFVPVVLSDANGEFALEDIPTMVQPTLTVIARKDTGNTVLYGTVSGLTPTPGGITDAGIVVVSESSCVWDPDFGVDLTLSDDDFEPVTFSQGFTFPYFGTTWTDCFVGSNGYVTFGQGDDEYEDDEDWALREFTRVSPATFDWHPSCSGTVWGKQLPDRYVVTWDMVPEYSCMGANNMQLQMFSDGRVHFLYNGWTTILPDDEIWVTLTPGGQNVVASYIDFSEAGSGTAGPGTALVERFREDLDAFDLDFGCIAWTPTSAGGYDAVFSPTFAGLYSNGQITGELMPSIERGAGDLVLELVSSTGLRLVKPLHERGARFSGFSNLPIPAGYTLRLCSGRDVLGEASTVLRRRGVHAELEVRPVPPKPRK